MEVSIIFKIAAVGILVSVLTQVLKHSGREEQAFLTSLAGLLLVLFWILPISMNCLRMSRNCFCCDRSAAAGEEMWKLLKFLFWESRVYCWDI